MQVEGVVSRLTCMDMQSSHNDACIQLNATRLLVVTCCRVDNGERDTWLVSGAADWVMQYRYAEQQPAN